MVGSVDAYAPEAAYHPSPCAASSASLGEAARTFRSGAVSQGSRAVGIGEAVRVKAVDGEYEVSAAGTCPHLLRIHELIGVEGPAYPKSDPLGRAVAPVVRAVHELVEFLPEILRRLVRPP